MNELIQLSPEVAAARAQGLPVVALESTIIAHGMPWPQNLDTAREVEAVIRAEGPCRPPSRSSVGASASA